MADAACAGLGRAVSAPRNLGRPGGLALPTTLVLLVWLGLLLAAAQRTVALQWRLAALQVARLQAREDARAAVAAAEHWLLGGGYRQPPQDCRLPAQAAGVRVCDAQPPHPAHGPWPHDARQGIDGCAGRCGFHLQWLADDGGDDGAGGARRARYRIRAYGGGAAPSVLRLDVVVEQRCDGPPRLWRQAWRVLR